MNNSSKPVSRAQKIVNHVFPFFGELARQHSSDIQALSICKQLIGLKGTALLEPVVLPLLHTWHDECPEEPPLQEHELHWALHELEAHLSKQLHDLHTRRAEPVETKPARPKLRLIQGGKSGKNLKGEL
ncbi:hypothetical protein ACUNV4_29130 [Granulosicoccus sp. 3-233]|uniref:hypothetical protein n=1 Tax=Granulosicoccus sp. 3-233 TaxID=3417969 RepID=UPI003D32BE7E